MWSEQHYTMYWQALGDLVGGRGVIKISMTGELLYKLLYVLVGIPSKGGGFICVTPPPPMVCIRLPHFSIQRTSEHCDVGH